MASSDWREVLENRDVESVLIALPTNLHAGAAIAALDAGSIFTSKKPPGGGATASAPRDSITATARSFPQFLTRREFDGCYSTITGPGARAAG